MEKFDFQGKNKQQYESSAKIMFWSMLAMILILVISFFLSSSFTESEKPVKLVTISVIDKVSIVHNDTLTQKGIIIGDSQSPFVDWGSESFNLISEKGGQSSLWLGGKSLSWLLESLKVYGGDSSVTDLAICIGTNGAFNKNDKISELVTECKSKFSNAKLYVIQGSWGWGGVSNKTEVQVRDYYKKFSDLGVVVVEPPIGKCEPHGRKPIYKVIGKNLDSLVKITKQ